MPFCALFVILCCASVQDQNPCVAFRHCSSESLCFVSSFCPSFLVVLTSLSGCFTFILFLIFSFEANNVPHRLLSFPSCPLPLFLVFSLCGMPVGSLPIGHPVLAPHSYITKPLFSLSTGMKLPPTSVYMEKTTIWLQTTRLFSYTPRSSSRSMVPFAWMPLFLNQLLVILPTTPTRIPCLASSIPAFLVLPLFLHRVPPPFLLSLVTSLLFRSLSRSMSEMLLGHPLSCAYIPQLYLLGSNFCYLFSIGFDKSTPRWANTSIPNVQSSIFYFATCHQNFPPPSIPLPGRVAVNGPIVLKLLSISYGVSAIATPSTSNLGPGASLTATSPSSSPKKRRFNGRVKDSALDATPSTAPALPGAPLPLLYTIAQEVDDPLPGYVPF